MSVVYEAQKEGNANSGLRSNESPNNRQCTRCSKMITIYARDGRISEVSERLRLISCLILIGMPSVVQERRVS